MYGVDLCRRVRLACHREGLSRQEASRQFGIDRKTVAKILLHSEPPGYRRRQPPKRPKLAPFTDIIDGILEEDRTVHRKQRHTAKRIFERLRDEHGFTGKQTIVKDYVRERHLGLREMFVPLAHHRAGLSGNLLDERSGRVSDSVVVGTADNRFDGRVGADADPKISCYLPLPAPARL